MTKTPVKLSITKRGLSTMTDFFSDLVQQEIGDSPEVQRALEAIQEETYDGASIFDSEADDDDFPMAPIPPQASQVEDESCDEVSFVGEGEGAAMLQVNFGGTFNPSLSKSTLRQRKMILKAYDAFLSSRGESRTDGQDYPILLIKDDDGSLKNDIDWTHISDFAAYFRNVHHKGKPTYHQWKPFMDVMQYFLNQNFLDNGYAERKAAIRHHRIIKAITQDIVTTKAKRMEQDHPDIHRNLLRRTAKQLKMDFVEVCMVPTNEELQAQEVLWRTQVCTMFLVSNCTLQRSEHLLDQKYKYSATRMFPNLGPDGTECDVLIANKGKVNRTGHVEAKGVPPHMINTRDASAMLGCLLVLRHTIMGETFPCFTSYDIKDKNSYCNRFLLRGWNSAHSQFNADKCRAVWNIVNDTVGIFVEKVTHQPRVEMQEEMMDLDVRDSTNERISGRVAPGGKKMNESTKASYAQMPPVEGLAAVGGGDPKNPQQYVVVWALVLHRVEEVMQMIAPWYFQERADVDSRIELIRQVSKSKKAELAALNEKRLWMAEGSLDAVSLRLQRLVQVAAARPCDVKGRVLPNSDPNYKRWNQHPVFQHHAFNSEAFLELVEKMNEAQEVEAKLNFEVPSHIRNDLERVVSSMVVHPINNQYALLQAAMNTRLGTLEGLMKQVQGMLYQIMSSNGSLLMPTNNEFAQSTEQGRMFAREQVQTEAQATVVHNQQRIEEAAARRVRALQPVLPTTTKDGKKRTRAPKRKVNHLLNDGVGSYLWSTQFVTMNEYWDEFQYGSPGRAPLRQLEDSMGSKWRSDTLIGKTNGDKKSSALKNQWSQRTPLYNYVLWLCYNNPVGEECMSEQQACDKIQADYFENDEYCSIMGKPKLGLIATAIRKKLKELGAPTDYPKRNGDGTLDVQNATDIYAVLHSEE